MNREGFSFFRTSTALRKPSRAPNTSGYTLTVDLELCTVGDDGGWVESFSIDDHRRRCLLQGLDDIGLTLQQADRIAGYERRRVPEA